MSSRNTKEKAGLGPGFFRATSQQLNCEHIAEQALAGIRSRLSSAGGQMLRIASDGAFIVITPHMHAIRFGNLSALEAYADRARV